MHFACFCSVWFVSQRLSCFSGVCVFVRVSTVGGMQLLSHSMVGEQEPAAAAAGKEEQQ